MLIQIILLGHQFEFEHVMTVHVQNCDLIW